MPSKFISLKDSSIAQVQNSFQTYLHIVIDTILLKTWYVSRYFYLRTTITFLQCTKHIQPQSGIKHCNFFFPPKICIFALQQFLHTVLISYLLLYLFIWAMKATKNARFSLKEYKNYENKHLTKSTLPLNSSILLFQIFTIT